MRSNQWSIVDLIAKYSSPLSWNHLPSYGIFTSFRSEPTRSMIFFSFSDLIYTTTVFRVTDYFSAIKLVIHPGSLFINSKISLSLSVTLSVTLIILSSITYSFSKVSISEASALTNGLAISHNSSFSFCFTSITISRLS